MHLTHILYLIYVVNCEGRIIIVGRRRVLVLDDHVGVCDGGVGDEYYEH